MRKVLLAAAIAVMSVGSVAQAVTPDWVPVGNAGNAADGNGRGAVPYNFQISRTEISNAQYVEFLNAADPGGVNAHALYNPFMTTGLGGPATTGGIDFNAGGLAGSKYAAKAQQGTKPVTWVSWNDAARFVNWLHNGQGSGTTELGVYDMGQTNPVRLSSATIVLPNRDEWYKAAFYDPSKAGGAGYWVYATRTSTEPNSDHPASLDFATNSVNFFRNDGAANGVNDGYAITGSAAFDSNQVYLTDIGAYPLSTSAYGTLDQNGNVFEWTETLATATQRDLRGGSWDQITFYLQSNNALQASPDGDGNYLGFRIALVPEPGSLGIVVFGALSLIAARRRA